MQYYSRNTLLSECIRKTQLLTTLLSECIRKTQLLTSTIFMKKERRQRSGINTIGTPGGYPPHMKKKIYNIYRVSKQYWSGSPEKKHKATKPTFNVGSSSACQGNAI